jgi:hypothetical protein
MMKAWMSTAAVGAFGLAMAAAGGCASYETYPAVPKNVALNDPNTVAMEQVMACGLSWVASKYPPSGEGPEATAMGAPETPFAINLPPGSTYRTYERVAEAVGMGARPLSKETAELPTYHVAYVRVRGDEAQLHVIRPVISLSEPGKTVPQEIKLQLRGGIRPWHVEASREWQVGLAEVPEANYYERPAAAPAAVPSKPQEHAFVPNPSPNPPLSEPTKPETPATAGVPEKAPE